MPPPAPRVVPPDFRKACHRAGLGLPHLALAPRIIRLREHQDLGGNTVRNPRQEGLAPRPRR